jgi:hypothetical protein
VTATASFGAIGFEGTEAPDFSILVKEAYKALLAAKKSWRQPDQDSEVCQN